MKITNKYITGTGRKFKTLDDALAYANRYYARNGVFISVEEIRK